MSNRWIIGVDGSLGSRAALEWALRQGNRLDAELVVVNAYPASRSHRAAVLIGGQSERESGRAATALAELEASIEDIADDDRVERVVADGHAGRALIAAAEGADLLVVGRHGTGGARHGSIGSVSRYCVTHAPIATVVVPTDWHRVSLERIVVGFDGSSHSDAAIRWALAFADGAATIRALVAIEIAPWLSEEIARVHLGDELHHEEQRMRSRLDEVDPDGLVTRDVLVKGARPALARAAERADLIVLGQRGAGALTSMVVGSVVTWMLAAARTPLAVIPDGSIQP